MNKNHLLKRFGLIAASAFALTLAACGNDDTADTDTGSNNNTASEPAENSDENVTLTFAHWDTNQSPALQAIIDQFESENSNIQVELETTPWDQYWTKMEAAATGGQMPDVVTMHSSEFYRYASNDTLMSMKPLVDNGDIDLANFSEGIDELYTYEDELYAVPKDVTTIAIAYNKELFDKAGVDYPTNDMTWDEFAELAKKVTNEEEGIWGFTVQPNEPEVVTYPFLFQAGGSVFNEDGTKSTFNNENNARALDFMKRLIDEKASPTQASLSETNFISLFEAEKAAMVPWGNWNAGYLAANENLDGKIGFVTLPKDEQQATVMNGLGWSVSANTEHPEAAQKFAAFLASEEANKIQAENGAGIPAYAGLGDLWSEAIPSLDTKAFTDSLEFGVIRPHSPEGIRFEETMSTVLNDFFSGNITSKEAVKEVEDRANEFLGQ